MWYERQASFTGLECTRGDRDAVGHESSRSHVMHHPFLGRGLAIKTRRYLHCVHSYRQLVYYYGQASRGQNTFVNTNASIYIYHHNDIVP